jgi:hypothetical protein
MVEGAWAEFRLRRNHERGGQRSTHPIVLRLSLGEQRVLELTSPTALLTLDTTTVA